MAGIHEGGCGCGDTRYEFACEPLSCYACHCTKCQTWSGAAFTLTAILPLTELNVTKAEPLTYKHEAITFKRCPTCSARLWAIWDPMSDFALLPVGTLDDTSWISPVAHIWTSSAQSWMGLNEDAMTFEGQPEDPTILLELWNKRQQA